MPIIVNKLGVGSLIMLKLLSNQSTNLQISNINLVLDQIRKGTAVARTLRSQEVQAATAQFKALGDLNQLRFDSNQQALSATEALTEAQNRYTNSIGESINQFNFLLSSIQRLFNAAGQGTRSGAQGQTGFGRGFVQFTNVLLELGQIVGTGSRLFHDPANDRLAELAGFRAGNVGAFRSASRQSARDFSNSFGRGYERAQARVASSGDQAPIIIENQIVLNDRTVQEFVNEINTQTQEGRLSLVR